MLDKAILQRLAVLDDATDHVRIISREYMDIRYSLLDVPCPPLKEKCAFC